MPPRPQECRKPPYNAKQRLHGLDLRIREARAVPWCAAPSLPRIQSAFSDYSVVNFSALPESRSVVTNTSKQQIRGTNEPTGKIWVTGRIFVKIP